MPDAGLWTIDELSELVAGVLRADHAEQFNGRVREVPDRRTIRWYTTIGLLDRPAAMRGRTALYGRRHLLQLVAVKRLQAEGRSLADVQQELVGTTDGALERIAKVPASPVVPAPAAPGPTALTPAVGAERRERRFWAAPGTASGPAPAAESSGNEARSEEMHDEDDRAASVGRSVVPGVRLGAGVTLLLGAAGRLPNADDLGAIERAAEPLLELLRLHGLDEPNSRRES